MATTAEFSGQSEEAELRRLVDNASQQGEPDYYKGKRRWTRYVIGTRLEVTTDPTDPAATWPTTVHNISRGGIGFWSKRMLPVDSAVYIYVREWREDHRGVWLPAHVRHCSLGLAGYLVGASFDILCAEAAHPTAASESDGLGEGVDTGHSQHPLPWFSLRLKCALAAAASSGIGAVAAAVVCGLVWPDPWSLWVPVLAVWLAIAAGGGIGWTTAASTTRFVETLRAATKRMVDGGADLSPPNKASTKELVALRLAYVELAAKLRQRIDAERVQKEKLEELNQVKSNILSIVSHDLRTPLTSILLYAKMLEDELTSLSEQDQRHFLKIICEECTRLSHLVDDLLEVQRLEAGRVRWDMRPQDVSRTIRACACSFEALARSRSMQFTVDCPPSLPEIEADADKIHQVLGNLLSNAFKYTPPGGAVHLAAEGRGSEVLLRVSDNGPGIPRDKWDQIFDRFTQLSDPNVSQVAGVGLGLYIIRQIIEHHGGKVWVESEPGLGSEFFVSLPTKVASVKPESEPKAESSCGRVLVCDADPELAATAAQVLRQRKFEVRVAPSGCRLLAQLDQWAPDLVLTDVLLPDMNGAELLDALIGRPERTFRLIVHSYAGDGPELRQRGVDVFLRRPALKAELIKAVQVAMQQPRAAGRKVLLLDSADMDVERFSGLLSHQGHMPIVVETLSAAGKLVGECPVDVVLMPDGLLSGQWMELKEFGRGLRDSAHVVVLCRRVGKKERGLAEAQGVIPLAYRPGQEQKIVDAVATCDQHRLAKEAY